MEYRVRRNQQAGSVVVSLLVCVAIAILVFAGALHVGDGISEKFRCQGAALGGGAARSESCGERSASAAIAPPPQTRSLGPRDEKRTATARLQATPPPPLPVDGERIEVPVVPIPWWGPSFYMPLAAYFAVKAFNFYLALDQRARLEEVMGVRVDVVEDRPLYWGKDLVGRRTVRLSPPDFTSLVDAALAEAEDHRIRILSISASAGDDGSIVFENGFRISAETFPAESEALERLKQAKVKNLVLNTPGLGETEAGRELMVDLANRLDLKVSARNEVLGEWTICEPELDSPDGSGCVTYSGLPNR